MLLELLYSQLFVSYVLFSSLIIEALCSYSNAGLLMTPPSFNLQRVTMNVAARFDGPSNILIR